MSRETRVQRGTVVVVVVVLLPVEPLVEWQT